MDGSFEVIVSFVNHKFVFVSGLYRDVKTMEESGEVINLHELSNDDEVEAKKKEAKEKEEREKQGTLIPSFGKC